MLSGLVAVVLMASPSAPEVWPHARECHVALSVKGSFSAQARNDLNLINAPHGAGVPPAPIAIEPEALAALNARRVEALKQALGDLGLAGSDSERDLGRWKAQAKPVAEGQGDRLFTLRAEIAGDNGLGGQHGGLDVHLVLGSLHRAPDILGEAWVTVPVTPPEAAPAALRATYVAGLTTAFADLKSHTEDEKLRPRATLTLRVELAGLSEAQRKDAARIARCAAGLAEPLEQSTRAATEEALELAVTYRLRRYEPDETEAAFLQAYAGRLSFEIGAHGKHRCTLFGTALAGLRAQVGQDPAARQVTVRFVSDEP